MKCNTFSESHDQADFNDDDGNNMYDKYHEDENDNNDNNNNDKDNKKILFFFKSIKCHTFSESQAQADSNDDGKDDNDNYNNDKYNKYNNNVLVFSKVLSVIHFRNYNLKPI